MDTDSNNSISGGRRRGGPIHDESAQGQCGEELAAPRNRGRQERRQEETGGTGSRTDTVDEENRNEMVDRVARYRFDYDRNR